MVRRTIKTLGMSSLALLGFILVSYVELYVFKNSTYGTIANILISTLCHDSYF